MKLAVISVTRKGSELAARLQQLLAGSGGRVCQGRAQLPGKPAGVSLSERTGRRAFSAL